MTLDQLEALLKAWGRVYGERRDEGVEGWPEEGSGMGPHPLEIARQFAIGKREKVKRDAWTPTHAAMLTKWAANGFRGRPPSWASEPVGGTPSRVRKVPPKYDKAFTPQLAAIEDAVMDLHRHDDLKARVVRYRYCTLADDKNAAEVLKIPLKQFREKRRDAVIWLHGRLAA